MMILFFELLVLAILLLILVTLYLDERNHRMRMRHLVKLKTYWDGVNRRAVVRHNVILDVDYRINNSPKQSKTRDISTHGIGLVLEEKLPKRTIMDLEIRLGQESEPLRAKAKVMWSKESFDEETGAKRLFHTGLKFLRFAETKHENMLFNYIGSIEKDSTEYVRL